MKQEANTIHYDSLVKSVIISIVSAIFAYLIIFLFTNYSALYFAYDFDIPATIDLNGINFEGDTNQVIWSRDALITILVSKPIASITAGVLFLTLLLVIGRKPISVIFLLFWLNIFAFNTAFGVLIDDSIVHSGTYDVAMEMNIGGISVIFMSVILAFILYKIGIINGRLMILSFPHQELFLLRNRITFFSAIFILPWLFVLGYSYLSGRSSIMVSEWLKNLTVLILLIPFLTASKIKNIDFKKLPLVEHTKTDLILSSLFVILSIVLIFVINNGITITGS